MLFGNFLGKGPLVYLLDTSKVGGKPKYSIVFMDPWLQYRKLHQVESFTCCISSIVLVVGMSSLSFTIVQS